MWYGNVEHRFVKSWFEGGIPIPYVPIRDGTRSKCDGNDVPGTLFRDEECVPNYLVLGRELESLLFFFLVF